MADFILSCCATVDLSKSRIDSRGLSFMSPPYYLDGKEYRDDLFQCMSAKDFYQAMVDGADTKTSQPNIEEFFRYFDALLAQGKDVLHISLSSGLSGTCQSARNAAKRAAEKYPERKICVVDSLAASAGYGMMVEKAADLRDEGKTMDEIVAWIEEHKLELHHWFFTSDLTFFIKGGRISKTAGLVGGLLGICPLLNVSNEGKLVAREKIRSKKKVIRAMADKMKEFALNGEEYSEKCYMSNSVCYEDAKAVADIIEAAFPKMNGKVLINDIGPSIGSHTGPGTVALFFWGAKRED